MHHELIIASPNVTRPSSGKVTVHVGGRGFGETMSYPTIEIGKKKIILLSERACGANKRLAIMARDQLEKSAKRHRDAVAFGYVSGMWIPAA